MTFGKRSLPRRVLPLALAIAGLLAVAPAAQATFHLIQVREVYAGSNDDSYVELQMYAAGQSLVGGHAVTVYNSAGTLTHTASFSSSVAKGENQRTALIGDSATEAKLGVKPDQVDPGLAIAAAGGAACWNAGGIPADCVAWGNFSGGAALQAATGTSAGSPVSAGGIATGKAIRRSIAPGCPTLLEESDDTNVSATDFSEVTPGPRNNAAAIVEATCPGVPNTAIDDKPEPRTNSTGANFTYDSPTATGFECKLDGAGFASCPADGQEYTGLTEASHTFQVRGVNGSGPDPTPASYTWAVDTTPPTATIDSKPADPSPGASAAFSFHASEASSFQCSLVPIGQPDSFSSCLSGTTYSGLADGEYTFKVLPTDQATNAGAAASYGWKVDNSLADTTPPQTTIDSKPSDPSASAAASFAYSSNEPGSSFECALDGAGFAPCPATGVSYSNLGSGPHSFQVRAIDPSGNPDPSPAGYSFTVVLAIPGPPAGGASGAGPAGPSAAPPPAATAAQTKLTGKPAARTHDRTPSFRFSADVGGARFECAVDRQPFKPCRSPFTTKALKPGSHSFSVRAVAGGAADPSPARFSFKVVGKG